MCFFFVGFTPFPTLASAADQINGSTISKGPVRPDACSSEAVNKQKKNTYFPDQGGACDLACGLWCVPCKALQLPAVAS